MPATVVDDLPPAVRFAASREGIAVLALDIDEQGIHRFKLTTTNDEPSLLVVTPLGEGRWDFAATIGRFGDPERERRFTRAIRDRLREVNELGWAPAPEEG